MTMIRDSVVLVTGANGGIGTRFVEAALARGAAKVYATARTPRTWGDDRVIPLTLNSIRSSRYARRRSRASSLSTSSGDSDTNHLIATLASTTTTGFNAAPHLLQHVWIPVTPAALYHVLPTRHLLLLCDV